MNRYEHCAEQLSSAATVERLCAEFLLIDRVKQDERLHRATDVLRIAAHNATVQFAMWFEPEHRADMIDPNYGNLVDGMILACEERVESIHRYCETVLALAVKEGRF